MKLFYLINEPFEGYQTGYRKALLKLKEEEILTDIFFFSFYPIEKQLGSWEAVIKKMVESVLKYEPNIILVAHLTDKPIAKEVVDYINLSLSKKPIWIYDERDVYGYIRKPLPKSILKFAANCDLVTLCNYGNMMNRFKKSGAKRVEYLPQAYDYNFGNDWEPTLERKYNVIMIANRSRSKIPIKSMPGVKEREQIVLKFSKEFGDKFAVFGKGWDGFLNCKGPINFFDQEKVLRESKLSIGWDHFYNYEGYYSDRLPIALVSGVPHLSYKTPGLEKLFEDGKHLFYFKSADEALILARSLLQKSEATLNQIGQNARSYVKDRFSEITRFKKIVKIGIDIYHNKNQE